jgi:hypothetical protein
MHKQQAEPPRLEGGAPTSECGPLGASLPEGQDPKSSQISQAQEALKSTTIPNSSTSLSAKGGS